MKHSVLSAVLLLAVAAPALAVPHSCETVKADIEQKIINNGVPESGFSLAIVPDGEVDQTGGSSVVGHCANETYKIVYTRHRDAQ